MTHSPRQIRDLLDSSGLAPRRSLGQNFVADANTVRRIARLADVGPGDRVVEIGAGLGSLTLALVETGARVTAVETDGGLAAVLRDVVADADPSVTVVEADARTLDWEDVLDPAAPWTVVANLPYNIATPLLLDLLDGVPQIERYLVMVQREAGERLVAAPGSKVYGVPSLKVAYWATGGIVGRVPPDVFVPRPKVESVLVALERRSEPPVDADPDVMFDLIRAGFQQRRKMLRSALKGRVTIEQLDEAGLRPEARAGEIELAGWAALARRVAG